MTNSLLFLLCTIASSTLLWNLVVAAGGPGVTSDLCQSESDCRAPRKCIVSENGGIVDCNPAIHIGCICSQSPILCDFPQADLHPHSCPAGERCVQFLTIENQSSSCVSCRAPYLSHSDVNVTDGTPPSCNTQFSSQLLLSLNWSVAQSYSPQDREGRNADPCTSIVHCKSPRICIASDHVINATKCSVGTSNQSCVCLNSQGLFRCTSQTDCDDPLENCVTTRSSEDEFSGICISTRFINASHNLIPISKNDWDLSDNSPTQMGPQENDTRSPDDSDTDTDARCIDAVALSHLPRSQLVFRSDRRASVLCDAWNSCATRGHMVEFNGRMMSMATYCKKHAECFAKVMAVNSPKMRRGLRIRSKSPALMYAPLAARYESRFEESVLKLLPLLGF